MCYMCGVCMVPRWYVWDVCVMYMMCVRYICEVCVVYVWYMYDAGECLYCMCIMCM